MRWILFVVPLFLAACGSGDGAGMVDGGVGDAGESPDARVAVDETAFVDAALADIFWGVLQNDGKIVISENIGKPSSFCTMPESLNRIHHDDPEFAEAFDDLISRSWKPGKVQSFGTLKTKHVIMTGEEQDAIFYGSDYDASWQRFYDAYPFADGAVGISWPGFTRDGAKGVIYVSHSCGNLCAISQFYAFELKDGVWTAHDLSYTCRVVS